MTLSCQCLIYTDPLFSQEIDAPIAQAVKLSILRHLWYLTESLVGFSLFDTTLSMAVKRDMADVLRQTPRHIVFGPEKPRFLTQLIQDANTWGSWPL